jgi:hypothetical protein
MEEKQNNHYLQNLTTTYNNEKLTMFKNLISLTSLSLVCLSVQAATSPIGYPQLNPQNQYNFYDDQRRLDTDGSTVLGIRLGHIGIAGPPYLYFKRRR